MGIFDDLKDRFHIGQNDYIEDEYEDDEYFEESVGDPSLRSAERSGLLGNTPRPAVNSVNVYSRGSQEDMGPANAYNPVAPYPKARATYEVPAPVSAQLPPYVLRPISYNDVQVVIKRVRTGQPVILSFKNTNIDVAKRILDFSFGLTCGIDGSVQELSDKVFVVLPPAMSLSQGDIDSLKSQGIISA